MSGYFRNNILFSKSPLKYQQPRNCIPHLRMQQSIVDDPPDKTSDRHPRQDKPVIWNKTLESYKDKHLTKKAWDTICLEINPEFEDMEDANKTEFRKSIQTKWTNIRDAFVRANKNIAKKKRSGSGAVTIKKYIYHDQLEFLLPTISPRETHDSMADDVLGITEDTQNDEIVVDDGPSRKSTSQGKKRKLDLVEEKLLEVLSEPEKKPNRHASFFDGIIPSLDSFTEDEILQFQSGVLRVIMDIKKQRQTTPQNTASASTSIYPYPSFPQTQFYPSSDSLYYGYPSYDHAGRKSTTD